MMLHEFHQSLGAVFTEVGGCPAVAHYGNPLAEHAALRQSAAVLDLSCRARLCLVGADRARYLHGQVTNDVKKLRLTLFIGSLIPFLVYIVWEFLILGVVPLPDLAAAWAAGESGVAPLSHLLQNPWIGGVASLFSFFAIITSFLGVSLSLSDFLTDGLKMKRFSFGREFSSLLTFVPPLFFVYTYPRGFILALQYAGISRHWRTLGF